MQDKQNQELKTSALKYGYMKEWSKFSGQEKKTNEEVLEQMNHRQ